MRLLQLAVAAALAVGVSTGVSAQTTGGDQSGTGTTTSGTTGTTGSSGTSGTTTGTSGTGTTRTGTQGTTTGTSGTSTATSGGQTTTTTTSTNSTTSGSGSGFFNRWQNQGMASGFVGASFNNNSDTLNSGSTASTGTSTGSSNSAGSSGDFGGSVGYLWHSVVGGEFLAGFTPNFEMANTLVPSADATPQVNTYMFNLMGAVPIGSEGRWQPYISGGWGAMTLHNASTTSSIVTSNGSTASFMEDENRAGGDIGFGVLAFLGNWGVRGDIRYFTAFSGDNTSNSTTTSGTNTSTNSGTTGTGSTGSNATSGASTTSATGTGDNGEFELLPGLNFWRANIGLAVRW